LSFATRATDDTFDNSMNYIRGKQDLLVAKVKGNDIGDILVGRL
jgi:hypothetical protein